MESEKPDMPQMIAESPLVEPSLPQSGRLPLVTEDDYRRVYQESVNHLGSYWASVAQELQWDESWQEDLVGELPDFKFFVGGKGNVSTNCIDRHLDTKGDKVALIWIAEDGQEKSWTYRELHQETAKMARVLNDWGIKSGDVVAIYLPNLLETFAAVHACYRIGAIYNIIFSGFSPQALYDRLIDTRPKVVITADEAWRRGRRIPLKNNLDTIIDRVSSVQHVVVVRRTQTPEVTMKIGRDHYWDDLVKPNTPLMPPLPLDANAPGFVIYTSGTTSKPKGLVHAGMGFLVSAYHNVKYALDLGPEDIYWCTADTGWLTFPIFELVGALAHGATALVYEGALDYPHPDRVYQIIEQHRVTKIFTAPTLLRMLARYGAEWIGTHDLSSLKLIGLVGEPLDANTWQWVRDVVGNGVLEINNTYGQSETGSAWTSSVVGVTRSKPGSCGVPLPGHRYAIVDDQGTRVPPGVEGYLLLTAPFPGLARTIFGDPERYRTQYFRQFPGAYNTADAAIEDLDGHMWVLGRVDDVINVSGHRLSTMEMESALLEVEGVSEAAVIGVADNIKGMVPVAFVTMNRQSPAMNQDDWRQFLSQSVVDAIGSIARPAQVFRLDAMPKTRSGKIVRRLLKELLQNGQATGDITGLEDPEILPVIMEQIGHQEK